MSGIVQGQVQREQEISAKTWRENVKALGCRVELSVSGWPLS